MKVSEIRTTREKILYPLAIIISIMVWGFVILGHISAYTAQPTLRDACVYKYEDDYETGETETYYEILTKKEAIGYGMKDSDCLAPDKIPAEEQKKALAYLKEKNTSGSLLIVMDFYVLFFMLFSYFTYALAMAHIRLNGVRISPAQYPSFYKIYEKTAQELGLKAIPNAYIIHQGGVLNAFTIKICRKKMVVFYAELVETLVDGHKFEELHAVAAHELTHVKLKHIHYNLFLLPFRIIPFLGSMLSRARELSADRGASMIVKDKEAVIQSLLKLGTGKFVAKEINIEEYINQLKTEGGFFVWLSKVLSTHPPIPYRIKMLEKNQRK